MAEHAYEKLAAQADEIAARLRAMKPSVRELDTERMRGDLSAFARGLDHIREARKAD